MKNITITIKEIDRLVCYLQENKTIGLDNIPVDFFSF